LWASDPYNPEVALDRRMPAYRPSLMLSRASPHLRRHQAMPMQTSYNHHRTGHASAIGGEPRWAASTFLPITTVKGITAARHKSTLGHGHPLLTLPRGLSPHPPRPRRRSTSQPAHQAPLRQRLPPLLPRRPYSPRHLHGGTASSVELPARLSSPLQKSHKRTPAMLAHDA